MYVKVACQWWRTGDFSEISKMGSPVTFWRWQAAPALAWMDASGRGAWINQPLDFISQSLPAFRFSALSFWLFGLGGVQGWAHSLYGRRAAFFAGLVYALGPNMMAHGSLFTMECPLWACWVWACWAFWAYLYNGKRIYFLWAAIMAGVTFSMKFTAVLLPPILMCAGVWQYLKEKSWKIRNTDLLVLLQQLTLFGLIMSLTNLVVTGFAVVPISQQRGGHPFLERNLSSEWAARLAAVLELPLPVDWVGFLNQIKHQRNGGPSYLWGEVSNHGWKWYYLVATGVKVPLAVLIAFAARFWLTDKKSGKHECFLPLTSFLFLAVACVMSKRNYGFRYLLPLAPVMIVWLAGFVQSRCGRIVAVVLISSLALNIIRVHPWELSYFNESVGSPEEGRKILADSNLDWGQGLLQLRALQTERPDLADITLFYFGDLEPARYEIKAKSYLIDASDRFEHLPESWDEVRSRYVAVSTSLSDGPWGPTAYFSILRQIRPVATTPDGSIRIYETKSVQNQIKYTQKPGTF